MNAKKGSGWADMGKEFQVRRDKQTLSKRDVGTKRKLEDPSQPPISAFFDTVPRVATPAPPVATPAPPVATPAPPIATPAPPVATPTPPVATPAPPVATPALTPAPPLVVPSVTPPVIERSIVAAPPTSLPWTEKYRPSSVVKVIGNSKAKETVQEWFRARQWRQPLLITGPTGIGKTSLAHAACRDYNFLVQDCNTLPGDLLVLVRELLHRKGNEQVALVLDEVHTYTSHERAELIKLFKRQLLLPVILICDELDKSMESLKGVCKVVRMYRQVVGVADVTTLTTVVLRAEGKGLYPAQLNMIHGAACGDLRRCTIMLELACKTRRCKATDQRADLFVDSLFDATSCLLYNKPRRVSGEEGLAMFKQHDLMKWMVHENFADVCNLEEAVSMATLLSDVDKLDAHPSHHCHEHADTLACAAVTSCIQSGPFAPSARVTFPAALATFSRRKGFQNMLHETRLTWHDWRLLSSNFSWLQQATKMTTKELSKVVNTYSLAHDGAL